MVCAPSPDDTARPHSATARDVSPAAAAFVIRSSASSETSPTMASTSSNVISAFPGHRRKLLDLSARQSPIRAEPVDQGLARVGGYAEARSLSTSRISPSRSSSVRVAGDGRRHCGLFEERAHRVVGLEIAGLDDERTLRSAPSSSMGLIAAAFTRRPATARTILGPPNVRHRPSWTWSLEGSPSRSVSSRRTGLMAAPLSSMSR